MPLTNINLDFIFIENKLKILLYKNKKNNNK